MTIEIMVTGSVRPKQLAPDVFECVSRIPVWDAGLAIALAHLQDHIELLVSSACIASTKQLYEALSRHPLLADMQERLIEGDVTTADQERIVALLHSECRYLLDHLVNVALMADRRHQSDEARNLAETARPAVPWLREDYGAGDAVAEDDRTPAHTSYYCDKLTGALLGLHRVFGDVQAHVPDSLQAATDVRPELSVSVQQDILAGPLRAVFRSLLALLVAEADTEMDSFPSVAALSEEMLTKWAPADLEAWCAALVEGEVEYIAIRRHSAGDLYLVGDADEADPESCFIVRAANERAAWEAYARREVQDAHFIEYVGGRIVNASFCERFWLATPGEQKAFMDTGEVPDMARTEFHDRVLDFFAPHEDWADLYCEHIFDADHPASRAAEFPVEMLVYIYEHASYGTPFVKAVADLERL